MLSKLKRLFLPAPAPVSVCQFGREWNAATLLLTGSADMPDYRLIADLIQGAAPKVHRIDYEGAGHMLHLERPEAFVADVMSFLN